MDATENKWKSLEGQTEVGAFLTRRMESNGKEGIMWKGKGEKWDVRIELLKELGKDGRKIWDV